MIHAYNATKHETTGYSPYFLMFGWHPRLSIDAFRGTQNGLLAEASRDSYIQKLDKRFKFVYKTAANEAQKTSRRHNSRYDLKACNSVLKPGDRVFLKNVSIRGRHKLANNWERTPYVIQSQPFKNIPVYVLRHEHGSKNTRIVHRNLILSIGSLPINEIS